MIPFCPDEVYKDKGWLGWNHWLGIETPPYTEMYKDFDSAKKYIKSLGLKDIFEWELYVAGLLKEKIYKPEEIPAHPDVIYKNYGWKGWFDWLGYEIVDFETARKFSRTLKLKSKKLGLIMSMVKLK